MASRVRRAVAKVVPAQASGMGEVAPPKPEGRPVSNSYAQVANLACPRCGAEIPVDVWVIVDAAERPDLAARIRDEAIHGTSCGTCGNRGEVVAPLLLYRPDAEPTLIFSPAPNSGDREQRDAGDLLALLRARLGPLWRDEWLAHGLTVLPGPSMALLLRAPQSAGVVAADQAAESFWQRYSATRSPGDLDTAIELWRQAAAIAEGNDSERARALYSLGRCLAERFDNRGDMADVLAGVWR